MNRERIDTVIIGGGQAGLAMSYLLTQQDREHVILEKNQRVGSSWQNRWDSFHLVTPNWQLQLPGFHYEGDNPDGFMPRDEVVSYLENYAASFNPPIRFGVEVTSVEQSDNVGRYFVNTIEGGYEANNVVVATGTFQYPNIPESSKNMSGKVEQLHSSEYRNPDGLPDGGVLVIGSGQSGCQIAQELKESGREVRMCIGEAGRLPRRYRGRDGMWWAMKLGMTERTVEQLDSPDERFVANPQISGKDGGQDINLHEFARDGMRLHGHLQYARNGQILIAEDMHQSLAAADQMATQFRRGVDKLVAETGLDAPEEKVDEPQDGYKQEEVSKLDLENAGIKNAIWATGYRWDYSWVKLPIFDDFDYPVQEKGVTDYPGLYFVGLHWLHKLKSGIFLGLGEDATHVAEHIAGRD